MNKQIQRLVDQAKASIPAGLEPTEWLEQYHAKFSELIVAECGMVADQWVNDEDDGRNLVSDRLRQHFGVEE